MGFLAPWFLAGALAVGLPIWLHLLKRHKSDPRPFPSLMFFEKREQSSVVHRRLDHILLFILRTLMLVLLALLFANPFINRDVVYYGAVQIAPFRILAQEVQQPAQHPYFSAALTVAFPGPLKY